MDERVTLAFARTRRAIGRGLSAEAVEELAGLERSVMEAFSDLDNQAHAVADANARAVEITEKLSVLSEQLSLQNEELRQQNKAIEEARAELELQSRAIAEAAVDAVLEAEASQEQLSRLEKKRTELERARLELERRTRELEQEAAALAVANADAVVLVLERESSLEQMASTAQRAEEERDALQERVFVDELTGLFNYRYFREQIRFEYARARRYGRKLSLIFVDLDFFKKVNDTHGHVVGDRVLSQVADLVQAQLRSSDIPVRVGREPVPIRYGGEELVIILPETDLTGASAIAERIRTAAEVHLYPAPGVDAPIRLTLSAGVACMSPQDGEAWDLVRRADEALYRAKAAGRNRVEVAS
jgi:diguanylate cyclase (GGDEF)-like protein